MILGDVCAYPRFAGSPVVDQLGIRAYMRAPLIDVTGTVLGTVCVVDVEQRPGAGTAWPSSRTRPRG
jgi:hypothetical protein